MSSSHIASDRQVPSVSAVVLTIGESTTERAIESVNRQSSPVSEVIVVRDEVPFHKALNKGAAQVRTTFFVQVDADMILDPECVKSLLACTSDNVGIVAGYLRDPLLGKACCVKLFRTACFDRDVFQNTVSPDTDFANEIEAQGLATVYAVRFDRDDPEDRHTFGQHNPDYTIDYSFRKHLVEGRRYVYRNHFPSFRWHMGQLEKRQSEVSFASQVAVAQGLFLDDQDDQLAPYGDGADQTILELFKRRFAGADADAATLILPILTFALSGKGCFERHYHFGVALAQSGMPRRMTRWIYRLDGRNGATDTIAKIAFCHGVFQSNYSPDEARRKRDFIRNFAGEFWPNHSWPEKIKARFAEAGAAFQLLRDQT